MGDDGSIPIQPDKAREDSTEPPKEIEEDGTIESIIRFTNSTGTIPLWIREREQDED